jgi:hypothetical protein
VSEPDKEPEEEDDDDILDEDADEEKESDGEEEEDEKESNDNCLQGLRCPKCRSTGPYEIAAETMAVMYDSGCDETTDIQWEDNSSCRCKECGFAGTVLDFEEPGDEGPERTFVVELCRTAHRNTTVRVQAISAASAKLAALARAGDLDYSVEKDAEYTVTYASEPAESI